MSGADQADHIPILMYHSISDEKSSTSISPAAFTMQMQAIADAGWTVATLSTFADWRLRGMPLAKRTLVITFDDAYQDFHDHAAPVLKRHGFPATVFVPTSLPGKTAAWPGAHEPHRPIMSWDTIRRLAAEGVSFAPHSRTHADLSRTSGSALTEEVAGAHEELAAQLGGASRHFAPPYGLSAPEADALIAATYDISVGVALDVATRTSPRHAVPRIEMLYYCDAGAWRSFLAGTGGAYLFARQAARAARRLLTSGPRASYG